MKYCAIKDCSNKSTDKDKENSISFHRFPTEKTFKNIWLGLCKEGTAEKNIVSASINNLKINNNMNTFCFIHFCVTYYKKSFILFFLYDQLLNNNSI